MEPLEVENDDGEAAIASLKEMFATKKPSFDMSQSMGGAEPVDKDAWRIAFEDLSFDQDDLISSGSAGEVFRGTLKGSEVAIKKLFSIPKEKRVLVERELAFLSEVNHPNIVKFYGICEHSTGVYFVTEFVEHGDLFDLLVFSGTKVPWKEKIYIALEVAKAVEYLHSQQIIHRDLKSQNILIGENHKVKLCDLGLARFFRKKSNHKKFTMVGTDEWMAPEISLQEDYNEKVDVFSFGIVLTELQTQTPPKKRAFSRKLAFDKEAYLNSVAPETPKEFPQLVLDCTCYDPDTRPSFQAITACLEEMYNKL